ncbi:MAG: hypothetical protein AB7K24_00695 [Gemmataceae bacterium]
MAFSSPPVTARLRGRTFDRRHLLSGAALAASLVAVIGFDFLMAGPDKKGAIEPPKMGPRDIGPLADTTPHIGLTFKEWNQRFGIAILDQADVRNREDKKRLTYALDGTTNNTCIKIDGYESLFGQNPGSWHGDRQGEIKDRRDGPRHVSTWKYPQNIFVTQTVMIVPNHLTGHYDTCLVHYKLENRDARGHTVGLRFMLDTFIGANDGVPFVLPGQTGLMDTKIDIRNSKDIPVYVQALEVADLANPGTIAHVGLKLPEEVRLDEGDPNLETMTRLVISRFPGNPEIRWDFVDKGKFWDMNDRTKGNENDSCLTMYWDYRPMVPGETRVLAFTYGLGRVGSGPRQDSRLALTASSGVVRRGHGLTVVAWVQDPRPNQRVQLTLPAGLQLASGVKAEQPVSMGKTRLGQVSWEVFATSEARPDTLQRLQASSGEQRDHLDIKVVGGYRGIFD